MNVPTLTPIQQGCLSIPQYSNYKVSKYGHVFNKKGRLLKTFRCHSGYDRIALKRDDGAYHKIYVHRAVALAHIPNPNNYEYIDHIDRNKLNNKMENLRWVTATMNSLNRTFNTEMPRYIRHKTFRVKKQDIPYWVIDVRNSILNVRVRYLCSEYTMEQVLTFRNALMTTNNIPITD
jgi:HNH endonuclease